MSNSQTQSVKSSVKSVKAVSNLEDKACNKVLPKVCPKPAPKLAKTSKGLLKEPVKTVAERAGIQPVMERAKEIHLIIQSAAPALPEPVKQKRARKPLSDEQREALRERLVKAREAKQVRAKLAKGS